MKICDIVDSEFIKIKTKKAFSLIETLVAAATISVLVAITLPAYNGVREESKKVFCQSNLRQIGYFHGMYASENNMFFPYSGMMNGEAYKKFAQESKQQKLYLCPADRYNKIDEIKKWNINQDDSCFASYFAMNLYMGQTSPLKDQMDSNKGIFWDINGGSILINPLTMNHISKSPPGGNILYGDFHASYSPHQLWLQANNPNRDN